MTDHTSAEALRVILAEEYERYNETWMVNAGRALRDNDCCEDTCMAALAAMQRVAALSHSQAQGGTITDEMFLPLSQEIEDCFPREMPNKIRRAMIAAKIRLAWQRFQHALSTPTDRGNALSDEEAEEHIAENRI